MMRAAIALLCFALVGCHPPARTTLPPAKGPGDCSTAKARLLELGGCQQDVEAFERHCLAEEMHEADIGLRLPVACLTAADDCHTFTQECSE